VTSIEQASNETGDPATPPDTRVVFIRHGESQVTVDQIVGGPEGCIGLSELGHRQAEALGVRWATGSEPDIDILFSSTMPRAIETAQHVNTALGLELHQERELEEWRPGEADGLPWKEVVERWGTDDPDERGPFVPWAPGGESLRDLHLRAGRAIDKVIREHKGKSIMMVVHAGVIDVGFRLLLGLPVDGGFHLWTKNTSVTEMVLSHPNAQDFGRRTEPQWRLVRYNDAAHLAGLPEKTESQNAH